MMKQRIAITAIIATVMFAGLAAIKHIDQLNDGIQFKQIEIQDNSSKLKLLREKYEKLNNDSSISKQEYEKQLKQLEDEKKQLESDLQARREAKERAVAQSTAGLAETATAASTSVTGSCPNVTAKLEQLGVSGDELSAAGTLAMRESSCNEYVVNAIGACGAFQSLPCGKWGSPGTTEYYQGAVGYVRGRYGTYQNALAHSYTNNWY